MAYIAKVPVFDADNLKGIFMVPVYDTDQEVIDAVKRGGAAGRVGPGGAILCYIDDDGAYRGELRIQGDTKAVCDAQQIETLAKWLSSYSHHCNR